MFPYRFQRAFSLRSYQLRFARRKVILLLPTELLSDVTEYFSRRLRRLSFDNPTGIGAGRVFRLFQPAHHPGRPYLIYRFDGLDSF